MMHAVHVLVIIIHSMRYKKDISNSITNTHSMYMQLDLLKANKEQD